MSVRRTFVPAVDHFTTIPNEWVRDPRLSLKARGLMVQLLSHRIGWVISLESLVRDNPEGRDAIRGAINELERFGYLVREQTREGGRFGEMAYVIGDPGEIPAAPSSGFPTTVNPTSDNPTPKKTISKKNISKNTRSDRVSEDETPSEEDKAFDEWYSLYPKKVDPKGARRAWAKAQREHPDVDFIATTKHWWAAVQAKARKRGEEVDMQFVPYPSSWLNGAKWDATGSKKLKGVRTDDTLFGGTNENHPAYSLSRAEVEDILDRDFMSPPDPPANLDFDEQTAWLQAWRRDRFRTRQMDAWTKRYQ